MKCFERIVDKMLNFGQNLHKNKFVDRTGVRLVLTDKKQIRYSSELNLSEKHF